MFELAPVILRNLLRGPATRRYPLVTREPFPRARGEIENEISRCTLCGLCARRCPARCLEVEPQSGRWRWDPFVCVYCGVCVETCPAHSLRQKETGRRPATSRETVLLQGEPRRRGGGARPAPPPDAPARERP
ncbi:MAG: 4Fe-4S binding protein [Desulfobacterales bacterium]